MLFLVSPAESSNRAAHGHAPSSRPPHIALAPSCRTSTVTAHTVASHLAANGREEGLIGTQRENMREELISSAIRALPSEYRALNRDGGAVVGRHIETLGDGGSSVVVRALYKEKLHRAVKFILPRDDLATTESGVDLFQRSFSNEVDSLAEVAHERIARITDFGEVQGESRQIPYFAMELILGQPIDAYAAADDVSGDQVVSALGQLLDALQYLHNRDIMHCDVKPDNFLVVHSTSSIPDHTQAYLVDLGVSHKLDATMPAEEWTHFFTTKGYHLPELNIAVANRSHNKILREELRRHFPAQDLYSVGAVLKELLSNPTVRRKFKEALGADALPALDEVASGLIRPQSQQAFKNIAEVRAALATVRASTLAPLGNTYLTAVTPKGIVLPDSMGRIATPGNLQAIISHPLFQRLHHLPQLDLMQYVLPGATHSRFAHALREMTLARKAVTYQANAWQFRLSVSPTDIRNTILSALVNSIGRYHLHHMFEDFYPYRGAISPTGLLKSDELLDIAAQGDESSPLGEFLGAVRDERGRSFTDVLSVDWSDIKALRDDPQDHIQGFLAGLLDSPLDVNKLAYLRADSVSTGMPFGKGISHDALFEHFRLPDQTDWERQGHDHKSVLGLREDGLSYAEAAVLARYWSIQAGYWNRTNRALQSMVKYVIAELLRAKSFDFVDYYQKTLHGTTVDALRYLSAAYDSSVAGGSITGDSVNPLSGLLASQRNAYRRLLTISPRSTVEARSQDAAIYNRIQGRSPLDDASIVSVVADAIRGQIPSIRIQPGEILLDVPRANRESSKGKVIVYADPPDAVSIGDIVTASPVLQNLGQSFELYVKRLRIFVSPGLSRVVGERHVEVHHAVLERLRSEAQEGRL